jgi:hypothetical protein
MRWLHRPAPWPREDEHRLLIDDNIYNTRHVALDMVNVSSHIPICSQLSRKKWAALALERRGLPRPADQMKRLVVPLSVLMTLSVGWLAYHMFKPAHALMVGQYIYLGLQKRRQELP